MSCSFSSTKWLEVELAHLDVSGLFCRRNSNQSIRYNRVSDTHLEPGVLLKSDTIGVLAEAVLDESKLALVVGGEGSVLQHGRVVQVGVQGLVPAGSTRLITVNIQHSIGSA